MSGFRPYGVKSVPGRVRKRFVAKVIGDGTFEVTRILPDIGGVVARRPVYGAGMIDLEPSPGGGNITILHKVPS